MSSDMTLACHNCGRPVNLRSLACAECGAGLTDEQTRRAAELPAPKPGNNGFAIASMVVGLVGLFVAPLLGSILAVVLGHVARRQLQNEPQDGEGFAVAGLIVGYFGIALWIGFAMMFVWFSKVVPAVF